MLRGRFSKPRRHHCRHTECSVRPTIGGVKKLLSWKRPVAGRARLSSARRVVAWVYGGALNNIGKSLSSVIFAKILDRKIGDRKMGRVSLVSAKIRILILNEFCLHFSVSNFSV